MDETTLLAVDAHLEAAADHHRDARGSHTDVVASLSRMSDLSARVGIALQAGDLSTARRVLAALDSEIEYAREQCSALAAHRHFLRRAIDLANQCFARAFPERLN